MQRKLITATTLTLLALVGCDTNSNDLDEVNKAAAQLPDLITFEQAGTVPEGIDYDNNNQRLLTGSVATGIVSEIHADGTLTPFINDPDITASIGIEIDEARQRLLVVNANIKAFRGEAKGHAKLGVYNLSDGKRIAMVDLGSADPNKDRARLANDVTVDDDGNIYITDTIARMIYKVDKNYKASVLLADVFNKHEAFMLNGLVAFESEFLLVAESLAGGLYKVPLASPENYARVSLNTSAEGADGITWHPNGNLLIPSNGTHRVIELHSNDNWHSATLVRSGEFEGLATTITVVGNDVYGVDPMFEQPQTQPIVRRIPLN
jgi:sugar lactone lactonase YvrE